MKRGIKKSGVCGLQKFFKVSEVSTRWGVSESTIRRMIERGELAITRFGNLVRISIEEIRKHEEADV